MYIHSYRVLQNKDNCLNYKKKNILFLWCCRELWPVWPVRVQIEFARWGCASATLVLIQLSTPNGPFANLQPWNLWPQTWTVFYMSSKKGLFLSGCLGYVVVSSLKDGYNALRTLIYHPEVWGYFSIRKRLRTVFFLLKT